MYVLTLNAGSSSIKCTLFECGVKTRSIFSLAITHIGSPEATMVSRIGESEKSTRSLGVSSYSVAITTLLDEVKGLSGDVMVSVIAHRVVYGTPFENHVRISEAVLETLRDLVPLDPDHLPQQLELMEACAHAFPSIPQVACFDTVFHRTMPRIAQMIPIPRKYMDMGAVRHGFHGLSYTYLVKRLREIHGETVQGRVIMAHLGSGASITALKNGVSVETSMGFTPASGLCMSTRSGDVDPGVFRFLSECHQGNMNEVYRILNTESGLLGVSGTSPHMYTLIQNQHADQNASEAVALFCYQVQKYIGAYTAVLNGLDALVFSGGIGEESAEVRARVCAQLGHLGVVIDEDRNQKNALCISREESKVQVFVIPTNEESVMAEIAVGILTL